jgi:hypothetical protein
MIVIAGFTLLPSVKADDWNEETAVTLNTSIAIPSHILQRGRTYGAPSSRPLLQFAFGCTGESRPSNQFLQHPLLLDALQAPF